MVANVTDALSAYSSAATRSLDAGMDARDTKPDRTFGDMVADMAEQAVETGRMAERVSADGVAGQADINDVVMAVNSAEMTLQTVVAIRDRVIQAYQDIIRMPV